MRRSELLLSRKFLIGILIWIAILIPESEPLRGSALVLQVKNKAAEPKPETDEQIASNNGSISTTNVTKSPLTGIPQIDYILDPNLPRELNGHNLTDYPFYNAIPDEIDFKCDGLHDGFYASVPHKCQVYHHCLFGTRFDFLCANYTAFDQKTFICHFVSEVDCDNSPKYYKRNEALYKEATTTSTTTTTTPTPSTTVNPQTTANGGGMRHGGGGTGGRRRRPYYRRRRPVYEYYYDDEEYADSEYYDDDMATINHRRNPNRKQNKDHYADNHDADTDYEGHADAVKPSVRTTSGSGSVYERPRAPPKIRRPVPKNERDKYDYTSKTPVAGAPTISTSSTTSTTSTERPQPTSAPKSKPSTQAPAEDEYYDEDEEYEYDEPRSVAAKGKHHTDYDFHGGYEESRRHVSRHRGRMPTRKRTDMYDDYDSKQRPKMSRRKEYVRYDMERPRNARPASHRGRQEDEAPSYSKKRLVDTDHRRRGPEKRPHVAHAADDDYYYDDEEEVEEPLPPPPSPKRQRRPLKTTEKPKANTKSSYSANNDQIYLEPRQHESTTKYPKGNIWRGAKSGATTAISPEEDTPRENEIPTTEHLSARTTLGYKTVKIVNNSLKDEDEGVDNVSTEETKSSLAQARPQGYIAVTRTLPKAQNQLQESRQPLPDEAPSRSIATPIRHFVITAPVRKPSHFGYFANSAVAAAAALPATNISYRDEIQAKLPEQPKVTVAAEYYKSSGKSGGAVAHLVKIPMQNVSAYHPVAAHGAFYVPMMEHTPQSPLTSSRKVKPVNEHHLPDTLNVISNGIAYGGALVTETKPFESAAKPQAYRQDHRLYAVGDRLYTNSVTFPHQPPSNFDITAPGPSAPADDSNSAAAATAPATAPEKKYSDLPSYNTANGDYDVAYNEALQPSTTHSVRRYPTTTFFVQNGPTSSRRLPAEYAFNEGAFNSLNRSHNRYK